MAPTQKEELRRYKGLPHLKPVTRVLHNLSWVCIPLQGRIQRVASINVVEIAV
jgi:hypothetical protein